MRLLSLTLQNFKGHKDLEIHFKDVTRITGANGTGKTSIFDAFMFVLTGKDSLGRVCGTGQKGEATIRPRQADGELVRKVEISVTARLLDDDGEVHTLQRIFCEQYSTDKNSGSKIFKGNTTKYFINEVPTPANKYDAWVKENIDPERLRLTGDPAFFPSMPWQDQRKWLLQVSGDVTDADVIAADPGLKQMEEMLGKHSVDDIKAMAAAKLKLANKTVKEDMIRIDQTVKMAGNVQESVLAEQIARQEEMVRAQDEMVARAESELQKAMNGGREIQVRAELEVWDRKAKDLEERRHNKLVQIRETFQAKAKYLQEEIQRVTGTADMQRRSYELYKTRLAEMEARKEALYAEYDDEEAREFTATECPFCHQPLPPDKLEKLRYQFNIEKSGSLQLIVAQGKQVAAMIQDDKKTMDALLAGIEADEKAAADTKKILDGIHDEEKAALATVPQLEDVAAFRDIRSKRDMLARELADLEKGAQVVLAPLQAAVEEARNIRASLLNKKSELVAQMNVLKSVGGLQEDLQTQRENADEASAILRMVALFTQTKCRMLTEQVNRLFPGLEWCLFTKNIGNDDIVETCELTMHGVGYRDLSQGEKIRAGLVIVDVLQEKLGTRNPVWIDGAESITFTPDVKSQLVLLRAQENIKELVIEEA